MEEDDFRTEWHARVAATRLSFECGTIEANTTTAEYSRLRNHNRPNAKVSFEDTFSLFCCDPMQQLCASFQGLHGQVQTYIRQFENRLIQDDDPLSTPLSTAVSISLDVDYKDGLSLMQSQVRPAQPRQYNEPEMPVWYPMTDRGVPPQYQQSDDESFGEESENDPPDGNDSPPDDHSDPPSDGIHPPAEDDERQSAIMYHLADPPIHAMLFWTDFVQLMREIALHYQVAREELFDSYEMTVRPPDIPDGTAPLLVHLVNDFPQEQHGFGSGGSGDSWESS